MVNKIKKKLTFDIYYELYIKLKIYCAKNNVKLKDFINTAIKEKIEK